MLALLLAAGTAGLGAGTLDTIGVVLLRAVTTNLSGAGVRVAQPEANENGTNQPLAFQVNPSNSAVAQSPGLFAYASHLGTASVFPNSVGTESGHADGVAGFFYGRSGGVATNVAHVDSLEADYFYDTFINVPAPPNPNARVINQSFIFGALPVSSQQAVDSVYDDAAASHDTLFVSGIGNGGQVCAPATCYNGIGVGAYGGGSSVGPTVDNGRCKPDLTAPAGATSFSTPQVAGAAAVLLQAGLRGDGGGDTNNASDSRTLKALLLNGAVKPANWTNATTSPLDARYGAGVLNVFNSYRQLAGGKHPAIEQTTVSPGAAHPPGSATTDIPVWSGWDFTTSSSSRTSDTIKHYYFNLTNAAGDSPFTATATLVWNRQNGQSGINDLNLYLYDTATDALVAESISGVDNVEHLYLETLPPGRYDLQVLKRGGSSPQRLTSGEDYALAWDFFNLALGITPVSETAVVLTWPIYPAGFGLQSNTNLTSPGAWSAVTGTPTVSNGLNHLQLTLTGEHRFFRLARP